MTKRMTRIAAACWMAAAAIAAAAPRQDMDLSGVWWLHPMPADQMQSPPETPAAAEAPEPAQATAEEKWQAVTAPGLYLLKEGQGAWLARAVDVGSDVRGRRYLLQFDSLYFRCRLFVNGQDIGAFWGGFAPWQADITAAIRPGVNQIQLGLTPAGLHGNELTNTEPVIRNDNGGRKVGLFEGARLRVVPELYIADVFALSAVTRSELTAQVEIVNAGAQAQTGQVMATVLELDGAKGLEVPPAPFSVEAGATQTVALTGAAKALKPWWPHDPHLYRLQVRLAPAAQAGDEHSVVFGFREVTIDGPRVLLNGKKLMLRGGSYVGRMADKEKAKSFWQYQMTNMHVNAMRTHYSPPTIASLEAADEVGLMLLPQGPIWAEGHRGEPDFWERLGDQYLRYIKARRNHPSVVIWSIGNEAGGMVPWCPNPGSPFMADIIRRAKRLDPTRPHTASHDYDMLGAGDLIDAPAMWGFEFDNTFPMAARAWYMYGYDFASMFRQRPRPVSDDESMEGYNHGHAAVLVGDKAYLNSVGGSDRRSYFARWAHSLSTKISVFEYRRQEQFVSVMLFGDRYSFFAITPESVAAHPELAPIAKRVNKEQGRLTWDPDVMAQMAQKSLKPAVVAPADWNGGVWAGRAHERPVIIMNDNFYDLSGHLRWAVLDEQDAVLKSGAERVALAAATHEKRMLRIPIPFSREPRAWKLRLELTDAKGTGLYEDDVELGVLPAVNWKSLQEVVLYPAAGNFARLKGGRVPFKHRVASELPSDGNTVVIVPGDVWLTDSQWAEVESFIARGGGVLILTDRSHPVYLGAVRVRSSNAGTVWAHTRTPDHPVVKDMPAAALRYWVGADGEFYSPPAKTNVPTITISRQAWYKPRQGNALPLIDAGMVHEEMGLTQSPLFEVRHGEGRALVCSLLLAEGLRTDEPAAARLLFNSLAYLQDRSQWIGGPLKPLKAIGADLSSYGVAITDDLKQAGTVFVQGPSAEGQALLSDPAQLAALLDFARQGGNLLLHRLSPEQAEALGQTLGIRLEPVLYKTDRFENTVTRMDWISDHPLRRGLSHFEIHWCETYAQENIKALQQILQVGLRSDDPRVVNLTYQGGLVAIPIGNGMIAIDQVLWDPDPDTAFWKRTDQLRPWSSGIRPRNAEDGPFANDYIRDRASAYVNQLLANLDVLFTPAPRRQPAAGEKTPSADTLALWHFDEGPVIYDYGPRCMDIPVYGKCQFTEGKFGKALRMNKDTSLAITRQQRHGVLMNRPQQTVELYIKPDGERTTDQFILAQGDASRSDHIHSALRIRPDGRIRFSWYEGGREMGIVSGSPVLTGEWTRVTIVMDHERQREDRLVSRTELYLNGHKEAEMEHGVVERREPMFIGRTPLSAWPVFEGALDELSINGRALRPEEVSASMP